MTVICATWETAESIVPVGDQLLGFIGEQMEMDRLYAHTMGKHAGNRRWRFQGGMEGGEVSGSSK